MSYNNFKSTTVRGAFNNLNYPDNSIKASAYFQNDLSVSGQIYTNNINTINLNGYIVSSLINSLSGSIFNNFRNQNLINNSLSGLIFNNFTNQYLINNSLSGLIFNNFTNQNLINNTLSSLISSSNNNINSINSSVSDIQVITNKFFWSGWANYLTLNTSLNLTDKLYFSPTSQITIGSTSLGYKSVICTNLLNLPYLDISSSIQTEFNKINTLLTGTTYDSVYNYLKFSNNVQVIGNLALDTGLQLVLPGPTYKYLNVNTLSYLEGVTSSIQTQLNNITSSTEVSSFINSLSGRIFINNNTITSNLNNYILSNNLNILTLSSVIFNNNNNQNSNLNNYITSNNLYTLSLSGRINNNNNNQNSNLNNYVTSNNLNILTLSSRINNQNSNLNNYIINNNLINTSLSNVIFNNNNITQGQINYIASNYATNLTLVDYAKLINNNIFTNNQHIYKNMYVDDALFNSINYMQLSLIADGGVCGIDFTTWAGRDGASSRIYGLDNNNYSNHLVFSTASPGVQQYESTERMRIQDDGKIGINITNPLYLLDVSGSLNANLIYENSTLLSSKYLGINATAAVSTRSINVAFTSDNSSTALCVAMTAATSSTTSTALRLDSNLRFNCSTNTLTSNLIGNVTGNCSGSSGSCTGNSATATIASSCSSIGLTEDITSIDAYIPFTLISTTITNALLKISSYLGYNPSTNTLSCNHRGSVTVQSGANLQLQPGATSNICPIGTILMMAVQAAPSGWLACNGVSASTTGTYAALFAVIGYSYGGSGGFFNIPDFQGAFLRGFGSPSTSRNLTYASNAIGTYQPSLIGSHSHSVSTSNNGVNTNIGTAFIPSDVNVQTNTTTETRPYNYAVAYYIKF